MSDAVPSPEPEAKPAEIPAPLARRLGLHSPDQLAPAWLRPTGGEQRWPVSLAVLVAIGLQLLLPDEMALRPKLLLPGLELALLIALFIANPGRVANRHPLLRLGGLALTALVMLANALSVALLINDLVAPSANTNTAGALLLAGGAVYCTNVIAFALWYWETDRGGPADRANFMRMEPDFLFPQMATPAVAPIHWEPRFFDYLYLSYTNVTAFSPTDTLPLSRWAKALMLVQSAISLITVALVIARAVNILR